MQHSEILWKDMKPVYMDRELIYFHHFSGEVEFTLELIFSGFLAAIYDRKTRSLLAPKIRVEVLPKKGKMLRSIKEVRAKGIYAVNKLSKDHYNPKDTS